MYPGVSKSIVPKSVRLALVILAGVAGWARLAGLLTTETFFLPPEPGNPAAAPYTDMLVNTSPSVTTLGGKGPRSACRAPRRSSTTAPAL